MEINEMSQKRPLKNESMCISWSLLFLPWMSKQYIATTWNYKNNKLVGKTFVIYGMGGMVIFFISAIFFISSRWKLRAKFKQSNRVLKTKRNKCIDSKTMLHSNHGNVIVCATGSFTSSNCANFIFATKIKWN